MRSLILVPALLLLASCDSGPEWENEQHELANELNASETDANSLDVGVETDYLNNVQPLVEDANAMAPPVNNLTTPSAVQE